MDAIGGILGLSKKVTKDVPASSRGQERTPDPVQDVGEDILAYLKEKV